MGEGRGDISQHCPTVKRERREETLRTVVPLFSLNLWENQASLRLVVPLFSNSETGDGNTLTVTRSSLTVRYENVQVSACTSVRAGRRAVRGVYGWHAGCTRGGGYTPWWVGRVYTVVGGGIYTLVYTSQGAYTPWYIPRREAMYTLVYTSQGG